MPVNTAAWQPPKHARLAVGPAPYTPPGDHQIVVRNRAVAINPVDWITQVVGDLIFSYIKYPFILGSDLAGEVVEVGSAVTRFKVGDRVLGHAVGFSPGRARASEGAFQAYTVVLEHMASAIPPSLSYEAAAVVPLGASTAACGLFQTDHLALDPPSLTAGPNGKTVLIWGGSTSVGSNAIQLAVAAGYEVFTTASPRNFDYVRSLGAGQAFDYNSKTVVKDLIAALRGKTCVGALAIGAGSAQPCMDVVHACQGRKFVSTASAPLSFADLADGRAVTPRFFAKVPAFLAYSFSIAIRSRLSGVGTKFIFGSSLADNEVGPMIYRDFLPAALASGQFRPAPAPHVVGVGLDSIQAAFDAQRQGVSASKIVVSL